MDGPTDERPTDCLTDGWTDRPIDRPTDRPTERPTERPTGTSAVAPDAPPLLNTKWHLDLQRYPNEAWQPLGSWQTVRDVLFVSGNGITYLKRLQLNPNCQKLSIINRDAIGSDVTVSYCDSLIIRHRRGPYMTGSCSFFNDPLLAD